MSGSSKSTSSNRFGLQIVGIDSNNNVFNEMRPSDPSWPDFIYGNNHYHTNTVSSTMFHEKLWVFAITKAGKIALSIRDVNGSWGEWHITNQPTNQNIVTLACCTVYAMKTKTKKEDISLFLFFVDANGKVSFYNYDKNAKVVSHEKLADSNFVDISCSFYNNEIRLNGREPDGTIGYGVVGSSPAVKFKRYWKKSESTSVATQVDYNTVYTLATVKGHIEYNLWGRNGLTRVDSPRKGGLGNTFIKSGIVDGYFQNVTCKKIGYNWQMFGATSDGRIWHTSRNRDAWTKFKEVDTAKQSVGQLIGAPFTVLQGPGLPKAIKSACLSLDEKSVYFFVEDHVAIYNIEKGRVIHEPVPIKDRFPTWPSEVYSSNDTIRISYRKSGSYSNPDAAAPSYHIIAILKDNPNENYFYVVLDETNVTDRLSGENAKVGYGGGKTLTVQHPYNVIGDAPNYSLDFNGTGMAIAHANKAPNYIPIPTPWISKKLQKSMCSALVLPNGNAYVFSRNQVFSYGRIIEITNNFFPGLPPENPNVHHLFSTNIAHVFEGVPLRHHKHQDQNNVDQVLKVKAAVALSQYSHVINEHRNKITASSTSVISFIKNAFTTNYGNFDLNSPLHASMKDAHSKGFSILWVGYRREAELYFSFGLTVGFAIDLNAFFNENRYNIKELSAITGAFGTGVGVEVSLLLGWHKGGWNEFFGKEWAITSSVTALGGITGTVEFDLLEVSGISVGAALGIEEELAAEAIYRYEPFISRLLSSN